MIKYKNILLASLVLSVTPFVYADKDLSRDNIQTVVMKLGPPMETCTLILVTLILKLTRHTSFF
jgi:hypothetical protein